MLEDIAKGGRVINGLPFVFEPAPARYLLHTGLEGALQFITDNRVRAVQ